MFLFVVELTLDLEVIFVSVLSLPEPEFADVIVIGLIQTAPPKFTIPPEMVPMEIPSLLIAKLFTPSPLFYYYMDKVIHLFKHLNK